MAYRVANITRIFGADGDAQQTVGEPITATVSRLTGGPTVGRHSVQVIATGALVAALTIWYSNLPNPDPANDAHWWQDTDFGSVSLAAGTVGKSVGNVCTNWIRYKVTFTSGT